MLQKLPGKSGEYPDILTGSIPEAKSGITGFKLIREGVKVG